MRSTVASARGRYACSARTSPGPSSKKASRSARCASSSPLSSRNDPPDPGRSAEVDPELIHLPVEGGERQPEQLGCLPLVLGRAPQHVLDVYALVRAQRLTQLVAHRRQGIIGIA